MWSRRSRVQTPLLTPDRKTWFGMEIPNQVFSRFRRLEAQSARHRASLIPDRTSGIQRHSPPVPASESDTAFSIAPLAANPPSPPAMATAWNHQMPRHPADAEKIASMAQVGLLDAIARNPASSLETNRFHQAATGSISRGVIRNPRDSPGLHHWHCPPLHNGPLVFPRARSEVSLAPVKPTPSCADASCRFVADRTD